MPSSSARWSHHLARISLLVAICGLATSPVVAHDSVDDQIARVTVQIRANPADADLIVRRAELYREARRWSDALADLDRAASLTPSPAATDLVRAHVLLDAGRHKEAIAAASRFLEHEPNHSGALTIRARAHASLRQIQSADADFAAALAVRPLPELFIERARMLSGVGNDGHERALHVLDEGIARLGPIVTLEIEAIDLDVRTGRYDDALARIDRVASQTPRKEEWLARRGLVLEKAGRSSSARDAYQAALDAIARQPSWTQTTPASVALRARLQTDLARIARQLSSSTQDHQ